MNMVTQSPLGKQSKYISEYRSDLLFPIARKQKRDEINVPAILPFKGVDIWNAFEISWLNNRGKPAVAVAEFIFPCTSPNIVESKSFKLYLNSFNNTRFDSFDAVKQIMTQDLSEACQEAVRVKLHSVSDFPRQQLSVFSGFNLDQLDIECNTYTIDPTLLRIEEGHVSEILFSDLLKSNCLVTGQPDWASLQIQYTGNKINHETLLQYIVSFRDHNEFHEQCVERIYMDILNYCKPEKLTVYARYTRRGGLDINPYRSSESDIIPDNMRLCRQ